MLEREEILPFDIGYARGLARGRLEAKVEITTNTLREDVQKIIKKSEGEKKAKYSTEKILEIIGCDEIHKTILKYPGVDKRQIINYYISTTEKYPF